MNPHWKLTRLIPFPLRWRLWTLLRPERATPRDLRAAYRLILGRVPDREGWNTFLPAIRSGSMSVRQLARCFLNGAEFRARLDADLRSRPDPVRVETDRFAILVSPPDTAIGKAIIETRRYEPHVARVLDERLRAGGAFVDVGCNVGYFSLYAARVVGAEGRVTAFDPNPANCELLTASAALNSMDNIEVVHAAVTDRPGRVGYEDIDGNGRIVDLDRVRGGAGRVEVEAVTLDRALAEHARIDLVKIDTEGAELLVLRGAEAVLARHAPDLVVEFSPTALGQVSGADARALPEFLHARGYRMAIVGEDGRAARPADGPDAILSAMRRIRTDHADLLAVRRR